MEPAREENDDVVKKKKKGGVLYAPLSFLSLSKTERDSPGNLPKVKPIVE